MSQDSTEAISATGDTKTAHPEKPGASDVTAVDENDISQDIDPENEIQGLRLILIHTALCLCTFLVGLDFNVIATAVPVITTDFNSIQDVGWYAASFMLALCASQPLAGKFYTLFPKKITYLIGLLIFEVGSLVCALSPSSHVLIAGRAIAGLGASGVFAGGFAIPTYIIPLHKRAIYNGLIGSTFAVASIVGPVIGGAFTQNVTWRWCFYINLPIGGASAIIVFFLLVHLKPAPTENVPLKDKLDGLDGIGFVLFAGSITMLLFALQWGGITYAWSSSTIIGLIVGCVVAMALFVWWQLRRGDAALIPPRLFRVNRNPALLCVAAFWMNGSFQVVIYWLPIWFQAVLGVSPTQSGIDYFPTVISDVLAAFIGSAIVMQVGWWNPFILLAEAFVCIGGGLLSTLYPQISDAKWIGYQIFGGIGYSLATNLSHLGMQSSLPQDLVPIGASTLLAVISTSCAIFNAVGQAVFQSRLKVNLEGVVSDEVVDRLISAGATNVASVVSSTELSSVIHQYSRSITEVFYIPAFSPVISFVLILGCKWISTKSKQTKTRGDAESGTA
ncbi:major facilitator superfamily domain-containing protein [Xylariomycetidae sp. FL2044]|nr:major facilitator superfamily domain-containing protein [Xylariomycetidae sp. FL2044]